MAAELNELLVAAYSGEDDVVSQLFEAVKADDPAKVKEKAADFDLLFDKWDDMENITEDIAQLCLHLAENNIFDSPSFRNVLNSTVKLLIPPYLSSQGIVKAAGARDNGVPVPEVAARLKKLQKIKSGALVNQHETRVWGKVSTIEKVTATFGVTSIFGGSLISTPVASALLSSSFFDPHPEMFNLLSPDKRNLPTAAYYRKAFKKHALSEIPDVRMKDIIQRVIVPETLSLDAFNLWWGKEDDKPGAGPAKRQPCDARSVLELDTLLLPFEELGGVKLNEEGTAKLAKLFTHLKPLINAKDITMLGDCVAMLAQVNPAPVIGELVRPLRGKAPFFPADVETATIGKQLEVWGHISMKLLPAFIKAAHCIYSDEELTKLGMILPLRCLSTLLETVDIKTFAEVVFAQKDLSADVLLYIWKNRTKLPKNLVAIVDMGKVAEAISKENLPKEWTAAERELKRALFEKNDFQKFVIENADGDIPSIINALQRVRTFQMGECQSIMVKLSRHSDELRERIEGGEGKRLMSGSDNESVKADELITSAASLSKLAKELEDIVSVQIPENVAAIAHARSFGDFRENAEYDAAKERRRFLHRRRAELESVVHSASATKFKDVKLNGKVVLGTTVTLSDEKTGAKTVYYILGAWDGDPDRNRISYRTKLGEILLGAKIGDSVKLPNGSAVIQAIDPLPVELAKELAEEA